MEQFVQPAEVQAQSEGAEFLQLIGLGHVAQKPVVIGSETMSVEEFMRLPSCYAMAAPLLARLRNMSDAERADSPIPTIMHRQISAHLVRLGVDIAQDPNVQER